MKLRITIYILLLALIFGFASCSRRRRSPNTKSGTEQMRTSRQQDKTVVKMHKRNGVYHVPCKINGTEMEFIFDTGASDITMSLTEALFLYKQNKLTDKDFIGTEYYQIADGSVAEGSVVNLKSVSIGNTTLYNVKASIVHNTEAPLLLGQSALAKFGKISINYNRNEITFE
jgi:aspartyl protease family protein